MRAPLALLLTCGVALAQPVQPAPPRSFPVAEALANAPSVTIGNGRITARIATPDAARGFYRGTRFDQSGVITSLTLNGREFYGPWFDRTAPEVLDYTYTDDGLVAGPDSAVTGPAEEFAPLDFQPQPGLFVKIGVGVLAQPDSQPYDKYRHYRIADPGQWRVSHTRASITFTHTLSGAGRAYTYEKTLRLIPGTARLVIEHRLTNRGTAPITTTVYDHNFLRLTPGGAGVTVHFPFPLVPAQTPPADLARVDGTSLSYVRALGPRERLSLLLTGYGATPADYDFTVRETTGAGVHVRGDHPLIRLNTFALASTQAVEPMIAVAIAPGASMTWTYTYDFTAGG